MASILKCVMKTIYQNGSLSTTSIHFDKLQPPPLSASLLTSRHAKISTSKGWICGMCKGCPFLNNSEGIIWDLNEVDNPHNCRKSQSSPLGCVLQGEPPGDLSGDTETRADNLLFLQL